MLMMIWIFCLIDDKISNYQYFVNGSPLLHWVVSTSRILKNIRIFPVVFKTFGSNTNWMTNCPAIIKNNANHFMAMLIFKMLDCFWLVIGHKITALLHA